MSAQTKKSLGEAIDAVLNALTGLDEPSKLIAVKAACERLNISFGSAQPSAQIPTIPVTPGSTPNTVPSGLPPDTMTDIKTLKDRKNPSNDLEMVCLVAYYLKNFAPTDERKSEIQTEDIEKYFVQAQYPLPKAPNQTLLNAKAAGYLDSAGRGKYKLNPVGHNLVAHSLPRGKNKKS
jgi:hypothetical protein